MKLVTVFKALTTNEADIVRGRLEAAEFHPMIANEHGGVEMFGGFGGGDGGIFVRVPEDEAAEAKEFLTSSEATPEE